jgi:glycosyltransferase involved in cell wall biosynthesis
MKNPLVSVIIPTYNRIKYVSAAIDSVLQQDFTDYELILVDDGSTDQTRDLVRDKYGSRLSYHYQTNRGRSVARNYGASIARGTYLAFLDSDDYWHPRKLSEQVDYFIKEKNPKLALVCCSVMQIDENGEFQRNRPIGRHPHLKEYDLEAFFYSQIVYASPSNALLKRDCFEMVGGYDPDLEYGEDWDLIIRLRARWNFGYINKPLLFYRSRSIFEQDLPEACEIDFFLEQNLMVLRKSYNLLSDTAVERVKPRMESMLYQRAAFWCFCRDAWEKGSEYLTHAASLRPHCVNDKRLASQIIALWGVYGGINKFGKNGKLVESHFHSTYLKRLIQIWPTDLLSQRTVQKSILGGFYHNLSSQLKNTSGASRYAVTAMFHEPHYFFTPGNWRLIVGNVIPLMKSLL